MIECARHVNLVKVPIDIMESEAMIDRILSEVSCKQKTMLKQLMDILEGDKLARLACASVSVRERELSEKTQQLLNLVLYSQ